AAHHVRILIDDLDPAVVLAGPERGNESDGGFLIGAVCRGGIEAGISSIAREAEADTSEPGNAVAGRSGRGRGSERGEIALEVSAAVIAIQKKVTPDLPFKSRQARSRVDAGERAIRADDDVWAESADVAADAFAVESVAEEMEI